MKFSSAERALKSIFKQTFYTMFESKFTGLSSANKYNIFLQQHPTIHSMYLSSLIISVRIFLSYYINITFVSVPYNYYQGCRNEIRTVGARANTHTAKKIAKF